MEEKRVPTHIIHWQNDPLMVFNQFGEQMPEYQGVYEETINKIPPEYHYLIERQQWAGTIVTGTTWAQARDATFEEAMEAYHRIEPQYSASNKKLADM